jgi:hypothetical protein
MDQALRAIIYCPSSASTARCLRRCRQYCTEAGYSLVAEVDDGTGGWRYVMVLVARGMADIIVVDDRTHLPPDRTPRLEVVSEQERQRSAHRRR